MASGSNDEELYVQGLISMGFGQEQARIAVKQTHHCGVEPALNWLLQHAGELQDDPLADPDGASTSSAGVVWGVEPVTAAPQPPDVVIGVPSDAQVVVHPGGETAPATLVGITGECKVTLVVASNLAMSTGKIAAQCCHGMLGLYRQVMCTDAPWLEGWQEQGEKTVVLKTNNPADLDNLMAQAQDLGLPCYMVQDAGRTEVAAGSSTVLAVGGFSDIVDVVTGHLQTLR